MLLNLSRACCMFCLARSTTSCSEWRSPSLRAEIRPRLGRRSSLLGDLNEHASIYEPTKSRPSVLRSFWTECDSMQGGHSWYTTTSNWALPTWSQGYDASLNVTSRVRAFKSRGVRDDLRVERDAVAGVEGTSDGSSETRRKIELHSPYLYNLKHDPCIWMPLGG